MLLYCLCLPTKHEAIYHIQISKPICCYTTSSQLNHSAKLFVLFPILNYLWIGGGGGEVSLFLVQYWHIEYAYFSYIDLYLYF